MLYSLNSSNVDASSMESVTASFSALPGKLSHTPARSYTCKPVCFLCPVLRLQNDVLLRIFDFMGPEEVEAAECVSRRLRQFGGLSQQN